jgi:hypothetical protein
MKSFDQVVCVTWGGDHRHGLVIVASGCCCSQYKRIQHVALLEKGVITSIVINLFLNGVMYFETSALVRHLCILGASFT